MQLGIRSHLMIQSVTLLALVSISFPAFSFDVQGHRGARGVLPENSLPAFASAVAAGAKTLELDLALTKDGEIVIHHDFAINTTLCTNFDESISTKDLTIHNLTLNDVKKFECGHKQDPKFKKQIPIAGTKIATLGELFDLLDSIAHPHAKEIRLNVELKRNPLKPELTASPNDFAHTVIKFIKQRGFANRVTYSSFDLEVIESLRKEDPSATLAILFDFESLIAIESIYGALPLERIYRVAVKSRVQIISPEHSFLNSTEDIDSFHQKGWKVITWTVNSFERFKELIAMGVDGIITDYPQEMITKLEEDFTGVTN